MRDWDALSSQAAPEQENDEVMPSQPIMDELPPHWEVVVLGDIASEIGSGLTPRGGEKTYLESGIPFIRSQNVLMNKLSLEDVAYISSDVHISMSRSTVTPKDVLLNITGASIGRVAVAPDSLKTANVNQHVCRIRLLKETLPEFVSYFLASPKGQAQIMGIQSGTTRQGLNYGHVRALQIPFISLSEQQRIVAAIEQQFTRLDAGVAALKSAQTRLKRYRAAVLKAAVEGKLTEVWRAEHPDSEPASVLLQHILTERRVRWEADLRAKGRDPAKVRYEEPAGPDTTDLPALPEGWSWTRIEQILVEPTCNGISVKGTDTPPGIPALRLNSMSDAGFDYNERRYIPIAEDVAASLAIQEGDFFVSRGNRSLHLVGRGTLAQMPTERIVFPDTMIRLRFTKFGFLHKFIADIWPSRFVRTQIERTARTTAGIYKISQRDVESFVLPLPPLAEQQQIVTEVERRLSVLGELEATIEANLKRAERLRQSILSEAFAGRLVPQDPNDEPASVLLERIHEECQDGQNQQKGQARIKSGEKEPPLTPEVQSKHYQTAEATVLGIAKQADLWDV